MKQTLIGGIIGLTLMIFPFSAYALPTGVPFGGFVTSVVPCTCTVGVAIVYSMFFTGSNIPVPVGALYYVPPVPVFAFFQIAVPGTFELGTYAPGVQACATGLPPACVPFPTAGTLEYTGTSSLAPMSLLSSFGF